MNDDDINIAQRHRFGMAQEPNRVIRLIECEPSWHGMPWVVVVVVWAVVGIVWWVN